MISRLLFLVLTIAFIAITWFYSGKAKSEECPINAPIERCKCTANWKYIDENKQEKNPFIEDISARNECDCTRYRESFCNVDCPGNSEEEDNALCPGRKNRYPNVETHTCDCIFGGTLN